MLLPWKPYISAVAELLITFYLATFCCAMFFMYHGNHWIVPGIIMALLYLFVIFVCVKRLFQKFSLATIMLITPIAPLLALIIVVTMVPILEMLQIR